METIVIAVHMVVAAAIIGLILLQQGKGAEMGASFGSGSSQTVFGPQGTGNVFSRATALCTAVFFATSFSLAYIAKDKVSGALDVGIPSAEVIESVEQGSIEEALMLDEDEGVSLEDSEAVDVEMEAVIETSGSMTEEAPATETPAVEEATEETLPQQ